MKSHFFLSAAVFFLSLLPFSSRLSAAPSKPAVSPDSSWDIIHETRTDQTAKALFRMPAMAFIHGYVPAISFRLHLDEQNTPAILPQIAVGSSDSRLSELDRHRRVPRLLNRRSRFHGGAGYYLYNIDGIPYKADFLLTISLNQKDIPFQITDLKVFYMTDVRCPVPQGPKPEQNVFAIRSGNPLLIDYRGKPFIIAESISGLPMLHTLKKTQNHVTRDSAGRIIGHNLIHHDDPMADFRREAFITPAGELELSFRAVYKMAQKSNEGYRFTIPAAILDGAEYEFRYGSHTAYNSIRGKFDFSVSGPANRIFYDSRTRRIHTHLHYLFVKKGDMKLVFDFNPTGESAMGSTQPLCNKPTGTVSFVHRYGDKVVFGLTKFRRPEKMCNVVRIYSGDYDYYYRHSNSHVSYGNGAFLDNLGYRISFTRPEDTARRNRLLPDYPYWRDSYQMPFQSAVRSGHFAQVLSGWKELPENTEYFHGGPFFPNSCGTKISSGTAVYSLPLEAGIYSCAVVAGNWQEKTGPFTLICNGTPALTDITVEKGRFRHLFFSVYHRKPHQNLELKFIGKNISLNQLIIRNMISESEDYVFRREFWNVPGLSDFGLNPDPRRLAGKRPVLKSPVLGSALSPEVTPEKLIPGNQRIRAAAPTAPTSGKQEWAWNLRACFIGPGNAESGYTFTDENELKKLCTSLKQKGFNAILEQGLFWYNSYSETEKKEHLRHQRRVNDIIHDCGLKVIRHADGPSFNTVGHGVLSMSSMLDAMPMDAGALKTFQGIGCISNPRLKEMVFRLLGRYIVETDCDGLMIDECIAAYNPRCVCPHCRDKFKKDTGCVLPMPDEARDFLNPDNPLFSLWSEWKQRQTGEFYLEMRKYLDKIKPGVIITNYGLDFQMPEGRTPLLAPYVDIIGTEGGSNLLLNFRNMHTFRKLMASYSEKYRHPTWHSHIVDWAIYDSRMTGYLYWAINALNHTGIMLFTDNPSLESEWIMNWKNKMDYRNKKTVADIAIFHRTDFRYNFLSGRPQPIFEAFGISEMLTDEHIPHTYISTLNDIRELRKFKVIFFGNADILSLDELKMIRTYIRDGGRAVITGNFGALTPAYNPAENHQKFIEELTGMKITDRNFRREKINYILNGKTFELHSKCISMRNLSAEILAKAADGTPVIARKHHGAGFCLVSPVVAGMENHEDILFRGRPVTYRPNPQAAEFVRQLLNLTGHNRYPVMTDRKISKLLLETCRDTADGKYHIQLLNMNFRLPEIQLNKPSPILKVRREDAISPEKAVRLFLDFPADKATAFSPDWPKIVNLDVRKQKDGRAVIEIPAELIRIYTRIEIN